MHAHMHTAAAAAVLQCHNTTVMCAAVCGFYHIAAHITQRESTTSSTLVAYITVLRAAAWAPAKARDAAQISKALLECIHGIQYHLILHSSSSRRPEAQCTLLSIILYTCYIKF